MGHLVPNPNAQADGRTTTELGAVLPKTAEVRTSRLFVGGVDLVELARDQGTALYVMDVEHIKHQLTSYKEAFDLDITVAYAGKAFLNKAMVRILAEEGCYLDVSGGGELAIALAAGFDPAHVIVHGNNKTVQELTEAIEAGVGLIVVDCLEEIERISRIATERGIEQPVLLRIKPGVVADTHDYIVTGAEDSKFGFGITDGMAEQAVRTALENPGLKLKGLHIHLGSQIFSIRPYAEALGVLAAFAELMHTTYQCAPEILDLGGGLGIAYQASDEPATIAEYGRLITQHVTEAFGNVGAPEPTIIVEPGRSIVANAGVTLYTVGAIKDLKGIRCYVAIDGGMTDNIRPALYDARYEAVIANKANQARDTLVTLAGKHCESGDMIAVDASIQTPEVGDIVAVLGTGAYNATMSSNYNAQVRPAVVFVEQGAATVVQRRETYEDLLRRDLG
ncbi:MAG: diaminopimelate decarboxylase [Coriobacteriia bacterium]|nr:diaminopimelate decarboxylase [Coriobacteriia bacterium]